MSVLRKQLPAYGRELLRKRVAGLVPASGHVWIVDRFNFPKYAQGWQCVVPPGVDPLALDFRFVAGLEVTIVAATRERLDAIAHAAAAALPLRLIGVCGDPPAIVPYIKVTP